jgi:hypothetical protein
MKYIFALIIYTLTTSAGAETLSFPAFRIEIQDGWEHSTSKKHGDDSRAVISLRHHNGVGSLKMLSYKAPVIVSKDMLRKLTNLESSIALDWRQWGDYRGFQYSYFERGSFYRQWWLANQGTIIFITYQCDPESSNIETEAVEKMIRSIRVNKTQDGADSTVPPS